MRLEMKRKSCRMVYGVAGTTPQTVPRSEWETAMAKSTKKCTKCNAVKPLSEFHRNRSNKDGRFDYCKFCNCNHVCKWQKENRKSCNAKGRRWRARNPTYRGPNQTEQNRIASQVRQRRNPLAKAAHKAVHRAIRNGDLVRPSRCTFCNKACKPDAHHEDHLKPLEVKWLCRQCHADVHATDGVLA